jgi:hypothetical protein
VSNILLKKPWSNSRRDRRRWGSLHRGCRSPVDVNWAIFCWRSRGRIRGGTEGDGEVRGVADDREDWGSDVNWFAFANIYTCALLLQSQEVGLKLLIRFICWSVAGMEIYNNTTFSWVRATLFHSFPSSEASFLILKAGSRNKGRRLVQRQLLDRDMWLW